MVAVLQATGGYRTTTTTSTVPLALVADGGRGQSELVYVRYANAPGPPMPEYAHLIGHGSYELAFRDATLCVLHQGGLEGGAHACRSARDLSQCWTMSCLSMRSAAQMLGYSHMSAPSAPRGPRRRGPHCPFKRCSLALEAANRGAVRQSELVNAECEKQSSAIRRGCIRGEAYICAISQHGLRRTTHALTHLTHA